MTEAARAPGERRGLRSLRPSAAPFDGRFHERDARFWPLAPAAAAFSAHRDWPEPEQYALSGAPVRFAAASPRKRSRGAREPIDLDDLYDAHIARGVVPTRPRNWHDFLNALVWATFPRAKRALHERQHALLRAWIPPGAAALPNARTPEQDTLAVLDEGGIALLRAGDRELPVPFGHAFFEGLVLGAPAMIHRALVVEVSEMPAAPAAAVALADEALAAFVAGPLSPRMLRRYVTPRAR